MYSGDRLRELKRNYGDFSEINKCAIAEALLDADILVPVKRFGVPDVLVDHAEPNESKTELGLTSHQIAERVLQAFFKQQVSAVV